MSVNYTDFDKIWASTSPLTPYEFSESQYKEGWNFVGATPPSRQMWDKFMQQADEKMQYLYNHESVPVGHEYFTFNPNIPQGSLPLFGGEYSRETYSALWNWVQEQTGYLKTEAEWQQLYTTNAGNVPYYSDGDGSTTFRVPSLKCWVKGANGTVSEVGSYLAAGLPNITANATVRAWSVSGGSVFGDPIGALRNPVGTVTDVGIQAGSSNLTKTNFDFNASRSSSIYGNSTTVQPPSIVGMWLVKAYGVVEDTGSIDEQQYIDDRLATKLSVTGGTMLGAIKGDSLTLTAENGGNSASLILNSSGSATWNGKEIERVNARGTNYIRYESGLQVCFGSVSVSMSGAESAGGSGYYTYRKVFTYNFPVAFTNPIVAFANATGSVNYWLASVNNVYNTSADGFIMGNSNTATKTVFLVAFGWWK